ncbi:MAG: exo-beta-N-acetylmuramidase NamZ domain-containing protein [Cyclobacteriaceae bacterium]
MFRALLLILAISCSNNPKQPVAYQQSRKNQPDEPLVGARQLNELLPKLASQRVALLVNHTSLVGKTHLADTLLKRNVNLVKIFVPEHGFRGTADAGEEIKDGTDAKTGLPLISLYGANKKATPQQLADVDVVIFDIQDVGARFFTYVSSMHYMMEACAENNTKLIILDRPNPNGYVDGPVLQPEFKSFVGMHPVPIVHGLTVGELALMINGEGWLGENKKCSLEVIPVKNWTHDDFYSVPVRPSPNLPDDQSIKLYPSTCLFEGTVLSVGRGTPTPFQVIGHPDLKDMPFQFTPVRIDGMSKNPPYENTPCYGIDLRKVPVKRQLDLSYLIRMYQAFPDKEKFFISYFEKLAGTGTLREQIKQGLDEATIRESWQDELTRYKEIRKKYLLYP